MRRRSALFAILFTILVVIGTLAGGHAAGQDGTARAKTVNTHKPWVRWWWPGSAVDRQSLTRQMEELVRAGVGGVEITPIYGARGYEDRYIKFLAPEFMAMLEHVAREGQRLGLGIDMATGTGWPFGGPWVDQSHALTRAVLRDGKLAGEPTKMAQAMDHAVIAGRLAFESGRMPRRLYASASSPLAGVIGK